MTTALALFASATARADDLPNEGSPSDDPDLLGSPLTYAERLSADGKNVEYTPTRVENVLEWELNSLPGDTEARLLEGTIRIEKKSAESLRMNRFRAAAQLSTRLAEAGAEYSSLREVTTEQRSISVVLTFSHVYRWRKATLKQTQGLHDLRLAAASDRATAQVLGRRVVTAIQRARTVQIVYSFTTSTRREMRDLHTELYAKFDGATVSGNAEASFSSYELDTDRTLTARASVFIEGVLLEPTQRSENAREGWVAEILKSLNGNLGALTKAVSSALVSGASYRNAPIVRMAYTSPSNLINGWPQPESSLDLDVRDDCARSVLSVMDEQDRQLRVLRFIIRNSEKLRVSNDLRGQLKDKLKRIWKERMSTAFLARRVLRCTDNSELQEIMQELPVTVEAWDHELGNIDMRSLFVPGVWSTQANAAEHTDNKIKVGLYAWPSVDMSAGGELVEGVAVFLRQGRDAPLQLVRAHSPAEVEAIVRRQGYFGGKYGAWSLLLPERFDAVHVMFFPKPAAGDWKAEARRRYRKHFAPEFKKLVDEGWCYFIRIDLMTGASFMVPVGVPFHPPLEAEDFSIELQAK